MFGNRKCNVLLQVPEWRRIENIINCPPGNPLVGLIVWWAAMMRRPACWSARRSQVRPRRLIAPNRSSWGRSVPPFWFRLIIHSCLCSLTAKRMARCVSKTTAPGPCRISNCIAGNPSLHSENTATASFLHTTLWEYLTWIIKWSIAVVFYNFFQTQQNPYCIQSKKNLNLYQIAFQVNAP